MNERSELDHSKVDYDAAAPNVSMWGEEDALTEELLKNIHPTGTWANLGAGDGRYSGLLLGTVDRLVAIDNDSRALAKLTRDMPEEFRSKLDTQEGDITERLPFDDNFFDGVFCTATIHCFTEDLVRKILSEAIRLTRPGGLFIFDFLTDIRRELLQGGLYVYPGETSYSKDQAVSIINDVLGPYELEFFEEYRAKSEITDNGQVQYRWNGQVLLCQCLIHQ